MPPADPARGAVLNVQAVGIRKGARVLLSPLSYAGLYKVMQAEAHIRHMHSDATAESQEQMFLERTSQIKATNSATVAMYESSEEVSPYGKYRCPRGPARPQAYYLIEFQCNLGKRKSDVACRPQKFGHGREGTGCMLLEDAGLRIHQKE